MQNLRSEVYKYIGSKEDGSTIYKLIITVEEALLSNLEEDGCIPVWIDSLVDAMIGHLKQVFKQTTRDRHARVSEYLFNLLRIIEEQGIRPDDLEATINDLDGERLQKEGSILAKKREAFYYDITKRGDEREFKRVKKELKEEEDNLSSMKARLQSLKVSIFNDNF